MIAVTLGAMLSFAQAGARPEWLKAEPAARKSGADLAIAGLRSREHAAYAALRFGGQATDVVYLVFDCGGRLKPHDELHVIIPGHPRYDRGVRLRGRSIDGEVRFPKFSVEGLYGAITHTCDIELRTESKWDDNAVAVHLEARSTLREDEPRRRCSFTLSGPVETVMNGAAFLEPVPLITTPELKGRWDHRSDPPHIRGRIEMESFGVAPGAGMKNEIRIEVLRKDTGKRQYAQRIRIAPVGVRREFAHNVRFQFREHTEYVMSVTVDLAPFFGNLRTADTMVLR